MPPRASTPACVGGGRASQDTYQGHLWIVRGVESGIVHAQFVAGPPGEIVICPTGAAHHADDPPLAPSESRYSERRCSVANETAVRVQVVNACSSPLSIDWIDFGCEHSPRGTIAPGATWRQYSYDGHRFVISRENGALVRDFTVDVDTTALTVRCDDEGI